MRTLKVKGRVISGIGRGAYYVMKPEYSAFFERILKDSPFPGTLNIIVDSDITAEILPHTYAPKNYGAIKYAVGRFHEIPVIVIKPQKSVHPENVLEIVAPVSLRQKFNLKDGSEIEVYIFI